MDADVIENTSVIEEIEGHFQNFPDVPREVIVKIELLSREIGRAHV